MAKYLRRHFLKSFWLSALTASTYLMTSKASANNPLLSKFALKNIGKKEQKNTSMIKVGFLGCAHIHVKDYANYLKTLPNVQVVSIWDNDKNRAEKLANDLHSQIASSIEEVCQNKEIEIVIIASETHLHFPLLKSSLATKKHVFIEKPLTITSQEAIKTIPLVKQANVLFHCNYHYRNLPVMQELNYLIKNKLIGEPIHVHVSITHRGLFERWFDPYPWMLDITKAGCGGFGDEGTHAIDLISWFLGEPSSVFAMLCIDENKKIDIFGEGILSYKSNTIGHFSAGWNCQEDRAYVVASGTEGTAYVDNHSLFYLESKNKNQLINQIDLPALPPKTEMGLAKFLDAYENKKGDNLVTVEEAARNVVILEKLYQSFHKNSSQIISI